MAENIEEKIKSYRTAPFDARFPNTNQTRNCFQNYLGEDMDQRVMFDYPFNLSYIRLFRRMTGITKREMFMISYNHFMFLCIMCNFVSFINSIKNRDSRTYSMIIYACKCVVLSVHLCNHKHQIWPRCAKGKLRKGRFHSKK